MTGKIKVIKRNSVSEPEKPAQPEQKSKRQSAQRGGLDGYELGD